MLRPSENFGLVVHTHESVHGTVLPIVHCEDANEGGKVFFFKSVNLNQNLNNLLFLETLH